MTTSIPDQICDSKEKEKWRNLGEKKEALGWYIDLKFNYIG